MYESNDANNTDLQGEKMVKMRPGECRCTKRGVKYCYKPGIGVRFVGKC